MKNRKSRIIISILMAFTMVLSGLAQMLVLNDGSLEVHAANPSADATSWKEIQDAYALLGDGDILTVYLKSDIVAGSDNDDPYSIVISDNKQLVITVADPDNEAFTIYSQAGRDKYDSMFVVDSGSTLAIEKGVTLSGKTDDGTKQTCPDGNTYTSDKFTGTVNTNTNTYDPKGFFIHVKGGGEATLNGTVSDFVTSRNKSSTPRYVAPVVAYGDNAVFNLGSDGVIMNNLVGYIVDDGMANNDAQTIKQYVKGQGPNVPRVPSIQEQNENSANYEGRTRAKNAGIDGGAPGSGITATAGAVIYKDGAVGSIQGTITNNRADTGGIMASGSNTEVRIKDGTKIEKNVGVQFGGGSTVEQGACILMIDGTMSENVAWFGGGAVYATENGVDWLLGRIDKGEGVSPDFDARLDGEFIMAGGELTKNTAFTRGGAILADSDGVIIQKGKLTYNMGRMLGGAMYVMGDHPKYEYTVKMTGLYVHDNAAVSGEDKARRAATAPSGDILGEWGSGWDALNAPLQTLLQDPIECGDAGAILAGKVTGGAAKGNTDDWLDGTGAQGTGGGVWLCAYGNTIFDANSPSKVVITNNWATGAPAGPFNPSGAYHKTLGGSDLADAINNSQTSSDSRSGVAGGSDFHADTGNKGKVTIGNLEHAKWYNENTGNKYETEISDGRLNLVNKSTDPMLPGDIMVEVYGNLARHGGGLAADGTFIFGTGTDEATPSASMKIEKKWIGSVEKQPVTIRVNAKTVSGKEVVLAEVPLDGVANLPATEFDTIEELDPTGNTWNGRFNFPQTVETSSGTEKLYSLVYTGPTINTGGIGGFNVTADMELDPMTQNGKTALGAVIREGHKDDIKVLLGEPVYASSSSDPKLVKKDTDGSYICNGITITFEELKEDSKTGKLVKCEDYVFMASEIDLTNIDFGVSATPHYETSYDPLTGQIVYTTTVSYNVYLLDIPLTAPMANDNWPLTEKYVNKNVHSDIVNFDQEFVYDIMAYVPASATEFTISDELVNGLEFADKDGNPSTDPWEVVQAVVVKYSNNHEVGEDGTVESGAIVKTNTAGTPIDFIRWEKGWPAGQGYPDAWVKGWPNQGYGPQMSIEGNKLTVKIDEVINNPFDLEQARGRWIQVTFMARIKDEYRSLDALKALAAGTEGKTTSWEKTGTNKQAPDARDLTFANGDLNIVKTLKEMIGPDPIIWAAPGPSRLFARSERGDYYATSMGDKVGNTWALLTEGSADWTNADNRFNGRPPQSYDTGQLIDLGDESLSQLKTMPRVKGGTIEVVAEGPSRYFAKVIDGEGNVVYYQTYPLNDKTGAKWEVCPPSDIDNAITKIKGDAQTIRYLDLESKDFTISGNSKNWPVISEEKHEGMANQASYTVTFGNGMTRTYKTNTVTVKPFVPEEPKKPDEGDEVSPDDEGDEIKSAETGDKTRIFIWVLLMMLTAVETSILMIRRRVARR